MPMPAKGARIIQRKRRNRKPVWVIKDGDLEISTRTGDREQAEKELADYINAKGWTGGPARPSEITVAEILSAYSLEHVPTVAAPDRQGYAVAALIPFWGDLNVSDIKGETCRRYAKSRTRKVKEKTVPIAQATIRRELNTLQAALTYCRKEGYLTDAPLVTLPETPETNQRAMTRSEVAALLLAARKLGHRHIMRFILLSIYSGTRKSAALAVRMRGPSTVGGWFDLDAGLLYRRGEGERVTKKRRTPARMPRQLIAHARRWDAMGLTWAVEFQRMRVLDIKTAWRSTVTRADLGWNPTPHTLKHTAITWAIQGGATLEDAAAFFATSRETIERTYWHLSPNYQSGAVAAIESRRSVGLD